jgi:two-component system, NarL family, sensor histidine kinase DesK
VRVLPNDPFARLGYLWLAYLGAPLYFAIASHDSIVLALTLGSIAVFLPVYFWGYWLNGPMALAPIMATMVIGIAIAPFNDGAGVFFVYAGAFAFRVGSPRAAIGTLAGIIAIIVAHGALTGAGAQWIAWPAASTALIGGMMIYGGEAHQKRLAAEAESRRLAVVAERERISRDLHDLLGHTLSVIALKSELATRIGADAPERALSEMRDVEQISRQALAEVRRAVNGWGAPVRLAGELERARMALAAANVTTALEVASPRMSPEVEQTLAFVLRESVTNVIRHAGASRCEIRLSQSPEALVLSISDDGHGGGSDEGTGLRGMRARVTSIAGTLAREHDSGTRLTIVVPVTLAASESAV